MKSVLFLIVLFNFTLFSIAQGTFEDETHGFSMKYPADWTNPNKDTSCVFSFIYQFDPFGKMRLATSITLTAKKSNFNNDLESIALAYRRELYNRPDMEKEKILFEEITDFHGIDAVYIEGQAKITFFNKPIKWKMYLFEFRGNYYELSCVSPKKDWKRDQDHFTYMLESFHFYDL